MPIDNNQLLLFHLITALLLLVLSFAIGYCFARYCYACAMESRDPDVVLLRQTVVLNKRQQQARLLLAYGLLPVAVLVNRAILTIEQRQQTEAGGSRAETRQAEI
jgi:hypothetical protein